MQKIKVTICTGTACYVMGGAELLLLEENLPEDIRDSVEIEGSGCLQLCKDSTQGKAPFVMLNDKLITEATLPGLIERITTLARKDD